MANARGREYAINPLGGPDELNRKVSTDVADDLNKRVYAPIVHAEAEESTPAPAMEVEDSDVEDDEVVEEEDELEDEDE